MSKVGCLAGFLAAALLAAGCGDTMGSKPSATPAHPAAPAGPSWTVGPANTVSVHCPSRMEVGQTAQCAAFALDFFGYYSPNAVTWAGVGITVSSTGAVTPSTWGWASVFATIDGKTGSANIEVGDTQNPTVDLLGPLSIRPNRTCVWNAEVADHGKPPYTYSWSVTGATGTASGSQWTSSSTSGAFTLTVTVSDVEGRTGTAQRTVSISSIAPACPT